MGSKKSSAPAPAPTPTASDIAREQVKAQIQYAPQAAQAEFDIQQRFLPQLTQLQEDVRKNVFGGEQQVREALQQNILRQLQSPTGITPEQQQAQEAIRGRETERLQTALRTRANLGGGLFGGRAQGTEERAVSQLGQQFAAEDINREALARQQAIQSALPLLQVLFPDVNISPLQFQSPVISPEANLAGQQQTSLANLQAQSQQQASQNALLGSLFQSLGTAVGGMR